MSIGEIILLTLVAPVVLSITAYMVMKFGAAGYFRAKQRERTKQQNKLCQDQNE